MTNLQIGKRVVGQETPTYFIADISANHDGQLERAKSLIRLAKQCGADAAKFQHFRASKIVSDRGFRLLGKQLSHQARWQKSVFEVYQAASLPWEWTEALKECCEKEGIEFFSAPYDLEAVDMLDAYMDVYKIGSGDITWIEILEKIAKKQKPIILATGASDVSDVQRAVCAILSHNQKLALMQCNTSYTGSLENFDHIHLNALKLFQTLFPGLVLGLSDHTPGHSTVLGAVTLGARLIEKHFTDDNGRDGPDHPFSMNPKSWEEMVNRTRELERALGSGLKFVAGNEQETVVVQRRCLRASRALPVGTILTREAIDVLRPAPRDAISPFDIGKLIGQEVVRPLKHGDHFCWSDLTSPVEREVTTPANDRRR